MSQIRPRSDTDTDEDVAEEVVTRGNKRLQTLDGGAVVRRLATVEHAVGELGKQVALLSNLARANNALLKEVTTNMNTRIRAGNDLNMTMKAALINMDEAVASKVTRVLLQDLYPPDKGADSMSSWLEGWRQEFGLPVHVYPGNLTLAKLQEAVRSTRGRWFTTLRMVYYKELLNYLKEKRRNNGLQSSPTHILPRTLSKVVYFKGTEHRREAVALLELADNLDVDLEDDLSSTADMTFLRSTAATKALLNFIKAECRSHPGMTEDAFRTSGVARVSTHFRRVSRVVFKHLVARDGQGFSDSRRMDQRYVYEMIQSLYNAPTRSESVSETASGTTSSTTSTSTSTAHSAAHSGRSSTGSRSSARSTGSATGSTTRSTTSPSSSTVSSSTRRSLRSLDV